MASLKDGISGDLGAQRFEQARKAGHPYPGSIMTKANLKFYAEKTVKDGGEGVMSPLSCREVPAADQVV